MDRQIGIMLGSKQNMKTIVMALFMAGIFGVAGCRAAVSREQLVKNIGPEALVKAAWKTHANYIKANVDHTAGLIPPECWEEPIRCLKPVRVYLHRVNVVVVTNETKEQEEGLYICIPISSYIPDARDGFTRTSVAPDIWTYQRPGSSGSHRSTTR